MIQHFDGLKKYKRIAIATSGGADSMCLNKLAQLFLKESEIIALIVDHGLRQESHNEALWVQEYLKKQGVKSDILKIDLSNIKSSIQENARIARYDALTKYCIENKFEALLFGHNQDDQAETILMRILRGTGIDGLLGIPKNTSRNGVNIHRPLLHTTREEIEDILKECKWEWVNDPSNSNEKYTRVATRNLIKVMPEYTAKKLCYLAENMCRVSEFIEVSLHNFIKQVIEFGDVGECYINTSIFKQAPQELRLRALKFIINSYKFTHRSLRLEKLLNLDSKILQFKKSNSHGLVFNSAEDKVIIYRELEDVEGLKEIDGETLWDGIYNIATNAKNLYVGPLNSASKLKSKSKIKAEILRPSPAIYNKDGEFLFHPQLKIGDSTILSNFADLRRVERY